MNSHPSSLRHLGTLLAAGALLCLVPLLAAQINISGALSDSTTGPLLTGNVYRVVNHISVPVGSTLTIQPGVVIKFNQTIQFDVAGTLLVAGTAGQPVIMTDVRDDSAGGDTNANGPSNGSAGWWRGIEFASTSGASTVNWLEVRFTGDNFRPGIGIISANVALSHVTVSSGAQAGMNLYQSNCLPTIDACAFNGNNRAVEGVRLTSLPGFTNNTATGNAAFDTISIDHAVVSGTVVVTQANMLSNVVRLTNHASIPAGTTLVLENGVIFKMFQTLQWDVFGTLTCLGSVSQPVVFTDYRDDSHGGDTNKNGASNGSAGWWRGILFQQAGASGSVMSRATIRYSGDNFLSGIEIIDSAPSFSNCNVDAGSQAAVDFNNTNSHPTFTNCSFTNNNRAVDGVRLTSVPSFVNCTASGNVARDTIAVVDAAVGSNLTIAPANMLAGTLQIQNHVSVAAGVDLILQGGVVLKMTQTIQWDVFGRLLCMGSISTPVVLTDIRDDQFAGDTNKNGPTNGAPGWWRGINFHTSSDASALAFTLVRYCGDNFFSALEFFDADIAVASCVVDGCSQAAVDFNGTNAHPTISGSSFTGCNRAVDGVRLESVPSFINCVASGNAAFDTINVVDAVVTTNVVITSANMVGGAIRIANHVAVSTSGSLTFGEGVLLKMNQTIQWTIDGVLTCQGSAANPIVFTDFRDDVFGGDTNKNGMSVGSPGWWRGIVFNSTASNSVLEFVRVRFCGDNFFSAIEISSSNPTITDSIIELSSQAAIDLNNTVAQPVVERCRFDNSARATDGLSWFALPGFRHCTATGNGQNFSSVTTNIVGTNTNVESFNAVNGIAVVSAHVNVGATQVLRLGAGLVVKNTNTIQWDCVGELDLLGTGDRPVVITSFADDVGGDSNNNGPSSGSQNEWRGITYSPAALPSRCEYVLIRNCGDNFHRGLVVQSNAVRLTSVRVERSSQPGFDLAGLDGVGDNLVAFACGGSGFDLRAGTFTLRHATAVACGQFGFNRIAGSTWTGSITSSIAWGNGTSNYNGLLAGQLSFSNGSPTFAGTAGNIDSDPLFVAQASGDLRLSNLSPCLDAADQTIAPLVLVDHVEASRALDGFLAGLQPMSDMGAYEAASYTLGVTGIARTGSSMTFSVNGPFGLSVIVAGLVESAQALNCAGSPCWGYLTVGTTATVVPIDIGFVGLPIAITIPNLPFLEGFAFGVQGLGVLGTNTSIGNFTNRHRNVVFE